MFNANLSNFKPNKKYYGWYILAFLLLLWIVGYFWNIFFNQSRGSFIDLTLFLIDQSLILFANSVNFILQLFNLPKITWIKPIFGDSGRNYIIMKRLANASYTTLELSVLSMIFGFFIALLFATIMSLPKNVFQRFVQVYIDYHRSTPLLVQLLIIYFAIPPLVQGLGSFNILFLHFDYSRFTLSPFNASVLGLTLNTAAYQSEIIRGGIGAIPIGQTEAARGLGMTTSQTMQYVILPQAVRLIIPPLTNEGINVVLNSSLASVITEFELTLTARTLASYYYNTIDVYLQAAGFYFIMAFSLAKIAKRAEKKLRIPGLGMHNE